jgi:O-glycosyl hydrolase
MMSKVQAAIPRQMYFTEGSTDTTTHTIKTIGQMGEHVYRRSRQLGAAVAWNMATDEWEAEHWALSVRWNSDHQSKTQEIIRSGQYWALSHFSRHSSVPGEVESQSIAQNLMHIAFENPSGDRVLVLTNLGPHGM